MRMLGNEKIRHIARILQYVPVVVTFFFALSFWRKGFNEGAVAIGAVCIGLLLVNLLLHIRHIGAKIMAIRKPLGLVASVIIISIGGVSLAIGSIYAGIFYVLLGGLFMEILKGIWCWLFMEILKGKFELFAVLLFLYSLWASSF